MFTSSFSLHQYLYILIYSKTFSLLCSCLSGKFEFILWLWIFLDFFCLYELFFGSSWPLPSLVVLVLFCFFFLDLRLYDCSFCLYYINILLFPIALFWYRTTNDPLQKWTSICHWYWTSDYSSSLMHCSSTPIQSWPSPNFFPFFVNPLSYYLICESCSTTLIYEVFTCVPFRIS